jgi:hypothetical protein
MQQQPFVINPNFHQPVPAVPPAMNDLENAVMYRINVLERYKLAPIQVPINVLTQAVISESQVFIILLRMNVLKLIFSTLSRLWNK